MPKQLTPRLMTSEAIEKWLKNPADEAAASRYIAGECAEIRRRKPRQKVAFFSGVYNPYGIREVRMNAELERFCGQEED